MPVHVHPVLKNRELALEAAGLLVKQNSDGYNTHKAQGAATVNGAHIHVPVTRTFYFNGTVYVSTE